jgi:hypothetical protein
LPAQEATVPRTKVKLLRALSSNAVQSCENIDISCRSW